MIACYSREKKKEKKTNARILPPFRLEAALTWDLLRALL